MPIHHALLALLFVAPQVCQDPLAPAKLTKPLLILEMDGPDALRRAFLPTNFGSMLASRDARSIWPDLWEQVFLFSTPEHQVPVPAFWLGRYEVTNAQWQVFFDDPLNQVPEAMTTSADLNTLEALVSYQYGLSEGKDFQNAWLFLMHLNWERLSAHLNKAELADWDPLQSQAQKLPIPDGIKIDATRYLPPTYWENGKPKDEDLSRPVHGVSWNQALDFCEWAGFHLPLEREWERAARGSKARRFPWGNEWDPLKCLWNGFNAAIQKTKSAKRPVGNPQFVPSHPVAVDEPHGCLRVDAESVDLRPIPRVGIPNDAGAAGVAALHGAVHGGARTALRNRRRPAAGRPARCRRLRPGPGRPRPRRPPPDRPRPGRISSLIE